MEAELATVRNILRRGLIAHVLWNAVLLLAAIPIVLGSGIPEEEPIIPAAVAGLFLFSALFASVVPWCIAIRQAVKRPSYYANTDSNVVRLVHKYSMIYFLIWLILNPGTSLCYSLILLFIVALGLAIFMGL